MVNAGQLFDMLDDLPGRCDDYTVCFVNNNNYSRKVYPDICDQDTYEDDDGNENDCISIYCGDGEHSFNSVAELRDILDELKDDLGYDTEVDVELGEDSGLWMDICHRHPSVDDYHHQVDFYLN